MSCTVNTKDKNIVFVDGKGKSKMRFINNDGKEVYKVKIDDCLITKGKRCDFLLIDHNDIEHYVELKGQDISYACLQIEETIKVVSKNATKSAKHSFVVSTTCPLTTTDIQVLKVKFKKRYNSTLKIKNNECCHEIK